MSNDLQQARIEAADAEARRVLATYYAAGDFTDPDEFENAKWDHGYLNGYRDGLLAAADAPLPTVEQIAEVLRKHRRNKAINYGAKYACICGEVLRSNSHYAQSEHQAEAVRALFGEVADDE